jgi:hypothetical protein
MKGASTIRYKKHRDEKEQLLDRIPQKVNEAVFLVSGRISCSKSFVPVPCCAV